MSNAFDSMKNARPGEIVNGEHLLLGGIYDRNNRKIPPAHFYKRRYSWDGDPALIGCAIGCSFCYYRWIDTTASTIGNGKKGLQSIGDPEQAVTFLEQSKLFAANRDIVMLCARSDGSMQVDALTRFLSVFPHQNPVFILHRGYFGRKQADAWGQDQRAIYCTTITPDGFDQQSWTPIQVKKQIEGLRFLTHEAGIPHQRISVMLGPINSNNIEAALQLMMELADLGFPYLTYRGCSVGNFGVDPDVRKLQDLGFLDGKQDRQAAPGGHDYYTMKNWLAPEVEQNILGRGQQLGLRLYRHTGELYRQEFGIPVAYNRNNRWRRSLGQWQPVEIPRLQAYLRWLGYTPQRIEETAEGYLVHLPDGQTATEDIAMSVGAEFQSSILFSRHRIAPTLADLQFYQEHSLFHIPPELLETALQHQERSAHAADALGS